MNRGYGPSRMIYKSTNSDLFGDVLPLKVGAAIIRFIGDRQRALMRKLRVKSMKKLSIVIAALVTVTFAGNAFADGGNKINNSSTSQSASYSSSSAKGGNARATGGRASANNSGVNNSTRFQDKLQAPGLSVGGAYCSNSFGASFPGGGLGFSTMVRTCKTEIGARVAKTYLGSQAAAQYVCLQSEFKQLSVCRGRR